MLAALTVVDVSAQSFAYVANAGSNSIALINTGTFTMSGSITVPAGPGGIAVTPDGSTVYVSSANFGVISAVSAASHSVIASIHVGGTPMQMAMNPNGSQVYVVNQASNAISVISNATKTLTSTITVGGRPTGVAFSPDGTRAYVANLWSNNVSVINTSTAQVIATFSTGGGPASVAVTPNGQRIYVTNVSTNTITVHDTSGNVVHTIGGFVYPVSIAITPDGSRAFVVNESSASVSVIDIASNNVIAKTPVGVFPTSVAISTDGTRAFVTNEFGFSLSVLNTGSSAVVATLPGIGVYPIAVATVHPAGATPPSCSYSLSGNSSFGSGGGSGSVTVNAPGGCGWNASSDSSWLTISSGFSGSGNGLVNFSVASDTSGTRSGTLTIGGQRFTVTEQGPGFTAIRVHCGSPAFTDSNGVSWQADSGRNYSVTTSAIANTSTPVLYQQQSYAANGLTYQFSVPNGSHTVKLHFAEIYLTQPNQRVMNIVINGTTLQAGFDILSRTGPNTAFDLTFAASTNNGQITIQILPVIGTPALAAIEVL